MVRRLALTVFLMASCVWCLALVAGGGEGQSSNATSAFRPAASVDSLMHDQDHHFEVIAELLEDPGAKKRTKRLFRHAEILAELANVNVHHRTEADYRSWAARLRDMSLELAAEAKKEGGADEDRMGTLFQSMKKTCMACHDIYQ